MATAINDDAAVRAAVRDILRDSPWSAHRVWLHELLEGESGEIIAKAAASAIGEDVEAFRARVDALPKLDFFMASSAMRKSWRATAGVYIVPILDQDRAPRSLFGPDGRTFDVGSVDNSDPIFVMQPAEQRLARIYPQPDRS